MNAAFIRQNHTPVLELLFNGWSMDDRVAHALAGADDLLAVWDYTCFDLDLLPLLAGYREIRLTAWSLGVWSAAKYFENKEVAFADAVAVNGTLQPVSAEYGITPDIFAGTAANWLEERARERFNLRLAGGRAELAAFPGSGRSAESQQNELNSLLHNIMESLIPTNLFRLAVIGSRDRIFSPAAQRAAWQMTESRIVEIDSPHYPFALYPEVAELGKLG